MSFFSQEQLQNNSGAFEIGGGTLAPIPKDTRVVATCEEAKNDSYNGESYLNLKWRINLPQEYANRVIFQKLHIFDVVKGERAKGMLAAIGHNSGGKLFAAMQQNNEQAPSDYSLQGICNAPMVLLLDVWELEDKSKSGNWVKAVSAYNRQPAQPQQQAAPQIHQPTQQAPFAATTFAPAFDGDIPF